MWSAISVACGSMLAVEETELESAGATPSEMIGGPNTLGRKAQRYFMSIAR